jgi:hypothetical protein
LPRPRQTNALLGRAGDRRLASRHVPRFDDGTYAPMNLRRLKTMAEIRIDAVKAERMISQILREEKGLLPADANALAAIICQRLTAATPG